LPHRDSRRAEHPNIGLIGRLASYARINEYGFIETPYRKVVRTVPNETDKLVGQTLRERIVDPESEVVRTVPNEADKLVGQTLRERIVQR